jgi:hypothetical protein
MAILPKVLINRADYQIGGGVALRLRTQETLFLLDYLTHLSRVEENKSGIMRVVHVFMMEDGHMVKRRSEKMVKTQRRRRRWRWSINNELKRQRRRA